MPKHKGYQPSIKSKKESSACQKAYHSLGECEQKQFAKIFRRFYRLPDFGEIALVELVGKLGMHLGDHFPAKLDSFANQLTIGDMQKRK